MLCIRCLHQSIFKGNACGCSVCYVLVITQFDITKGQLHYAYQVLKFGNRRLSDILWTCVHFLPLVSRHWFPPLFLNLWTSARQFYTWQILSSFCYHLSVSYINVSVWAVPWSYFNLLGSYIYSDWCFNSEVPFDYFFIFVFTLIFYSFRFAVCNLIFLGEPSVLCNMCKLLLHMVLFSQIYIVIWAIRNLCRLRFSSRVIWSRLLVSFSTNSQQ